MTRFRVPRLPDDPKKALPVIAESLRQIFTDLASLERQPGDVALRATTHRAAPWETVRVSPPPEGMGLVLPPPDASNRGATVTVIIEAPDGDLRAFVSQDGPAGPAGAPTID